MAMITCMMVYDDSRVVCNLAGAMVVSSRHCGCIKLPALECVVLSLGMMKLWQ
jgi:hypothetical protein